LRGRAAARAPTGRVLASIAIEGERGRTAKVVVTERGTVAVDLFDGARRLARSPVPHVVPRGQLTDFYSGDGYLRVRWRNPDGSEADRAFVVMPGGLS
jgi:hypothetical protein